jgi:pimeloyl-ACP methyl ester carboxylesterase
MSLSKNIITLLPDRWQDRLLAKVIASNKWEKVPTFNMLFESYSIMGADREDMVKAFNLSKDFDLDFFNNCRMIAKSRENTAVSETDPAKARSEYLKAVFMYFLADWVSFEEEQITGNYNDLLAAADKMDILLSPPTEKVYIPWKKGHIAGRFRVPDSTGEKSAPVIVIVQGNDTVKECFILLEDLLLASGFAVLNIDQSGWGESRLSGNRFESLDDAKILAELVIAFLEKTSTVDQSKKAIFGFSGGGTWAAMTAGTDQRFDHMVSIGGSIYDLDKAIKWLPAIQKKQVMKHWGCKEDEIAPLIRSELDFKNRILPYITSKCLLIHGEKDTLVSVKGIYKAKEVINGPVDLVIVPGGDHMCTETLLDVQIPQIISWLSNNLKGALKT